MKKSVYRKSDGKKHAVWFHLDGKRWLKGRYTPAELYKAGEPQAKVYIVEGEKDVETLAQAYGYYAVSGPDGATGTKWTPELVRGLEGKEIVILPDNDEPGRTYATNAAAAVKPVAKSVKLLDLSAVWPDIPEHGDITDMFQSLGTDRTREELERLEQITPEWEPDAMAEQNFNHFIPLIHAEEIPPFPVSELPPVLENYVTACADSTEVDDSMLALPVLAAVSACVHNKFSVKTAWTEKNLALWTACVADPGERKTAAFSLATEPINKYVQERNERYKPLICEYKDKLTITQKQLAAATEKAAKADAKTADEAMERVCELRAMEQDILEHPEKEMRVYLGDTTPEALAEVMADNQGAIAMLSDEGGLLDTATGKTYGKVMSLDTMLKAYSGSPIQISRKTTGNIDIKNPSLAVGVMVQPVTVQTISKDPVLSGRGFVQRFLYDFPKSKAGRRKLANMEPPEEVVEAYGTLIHALLDLNGDSDNKRTIHCSDAAFQVLDTWYREFDRRLTEDLYSIRGWSSKLHGNILRIAALFHVCEHLDEADTVEIDLDTMKRAIIIGEHFIPAALKALGGAGGDEEDADALYTWEKLKSSDRITKSDLVRACRRFKAEAVDKALETLVSHGYCRIVKESTKGRNAVFIETNPEAKAG